MPAFATHSFYRYTIPLSHRWQCRSRRCGHSFPYLHKEPKAVSNTISNLQSIRCADDGVRCATAHSTTIVCFVHFVFRHFLCLSLLLCGFHECVSLTTLSPGKCMVNCEKDARSEWELSERFALQRNFIRDTIKCLTSPYPPPARACVQLNASTGRTRCDRGDASAMTRVVLVVVAAAARPTNGNGIFSQFRHVYIKRSQFLFPPPAPSWLSVRICSDAGVMLSSPFFLRLFVVFAHDRTIFLLFYFFAISIFFLLVAHTHLAFKYISNVNINRNATRHEFVFTSSHTNEKRRNIETFLWFTSKVPKYCWHVSILESSGVAVWRLLRASCTAFTMT